MAPRDSQQTAKTFGDLLREYRLRAGFSQETLAEAAGVSLSAIGALEQGIRRAPYRHTIGQLSDALALPAAERALLEQSADRARGRTRKTSEQAVASETNVPRPLTTFIERAEVDAIADLAARYPLVTITGSGGVGKTRTAIEVVRLRTNARNVPVWFLDLEPFRDGSVIAAEFAALLGLSLDSRPDAVAVMLRALKATRFDLIIDNCEHLLADAAIFVESLLGACPLASVIATSRERLGISGEIVYRLPSLHIAEAATALFVDRAQLADAHFRFDRAGLALVAEICRELDGIPLAIELAAARAPGLGLQALRRRLRESEGGFAHRDRPQRHQTMAAAIDWSLRLLSDSEMTLLRRLSVFVGGVSLLAAEHTCSDDILAVAQIEPLLEMLVRKSLVVPVHAGTQTRYVLLTMIREHASALLHARNEFDLMMKRVVQWFCDSAEDEHVNRKTNAWFAEIDNLRAALDWCVHSDRNVEAESAAQILGSFRRVWTMKARYTEYLQLSTAVLARIDEAAVPAWAGRIHIAVHHALAGAESLAAGMRAIELLTLAGDELTASVSRAFVGLIFLRMGRLEEAEENYRLAAEYFDRERERAGLSYAVYLSGRTWMMTCKGDFAAARAALTRMAELARRDPAMAIVAVDHDVLLAEIEFAEGNLAAAIAAGEQATRRSEELGNTSFTSSVNLLTYCAFAREDALIDLALTRLLGRYDSTIPEFERILQPLALVAADRGYVEIAARALGAVDAWYRRLALVRHATEQQTLERLTARLGERLSEVRLGEEMRAGEKLDLQDLIAQMLDLLLPHENDAASRDAASSLSAR